MDKSISSLAVADLVVVDINDRIDTVVDILDSHKLSCVPVVDSEGKCFGVISSPDIVHFQQMNLNPKAELAWEVCTHKIIEVSPGISVKEAAELMAKNKIHHIVITENNSLKGIVSSIDIIENCLLKQNA